MAFMFDAQVKCRIDLAQEWAGWKLRGRCLVSPTGERISVTRLSGILFREANEVRTRKAVKKPLGDLIRMPVRARQGS